MNSGRSRGSLKADGEVAADVGLADEVHQAELAPCGANSALDVGRDRNSAGSVGRQKGSALSVVLGLDVVHKCVEILLAGADLVNGLVGVFHFLVLLDDVSFFFAGAFCDGLADLALGGLRGFAVLELSVDRLDLGLEGVKIGAFVLDLGPDLLLAGLEFLDGHFVDVHLLISESIFIF